MPELWNVMIHPSGKGSVGGRPRPLKQIMALNLDRLLRRIEIKARFLFIVFSVTKNKMALKQNYKCFVERCCFNNKVYASNLD